MTIRTPPPRSYTSLPPACATVLGVSIFSLPPLHSLHIHASFEMNSQYFNATATLTAADNFNASPFALRPAWTSSGPMQTFDPRYFSQKNTAVYKVCTEIVDRRTLIPINLVLRRSSNCRTSVLPMTRGAIASLAHSAARLCHRSRLNHCGHLRSPPTLHTRRFHPP